MTALNSAPADSAGTGPSLLDGEDRRPSFTPTLLIIVYAVLLLLAFVVAYQLAPYDAKTGFGNFSKLATVLVTAVSALLAAIVTIINFDRNAKDARKLAILNGRIASQLAGYQSDLQKKLLDEKSSADKELEQFKAALAGEMEAYIDLFSAANYAYYTLQKLEGGRWDPGDKEKIDARMTKVAGKLGVLEPVIKFTRATWRGLRS
jgi:hypothetical protein